MSDFQQNTKAFEVWGFPLLDSHEMPETPLEATQHHEPESSGESVAQIAELQNKIQYIDAMALQIKTMLTHIDATLLTNVMILVKDAVKKIIRRELDLDDSLFRGMIKESLATFNKANEACILYVAADDYFIFEQYVPVHNITVLVDPSLEKGDFLIKTTLSEFHAILDDRLNILFKI